MDALSADLGPGDLEVSDEPEIVNGDDRRLAVLGRRDELEPTVGGQGPADDLGSLGDLVRRDGDAHERFRGDVVGGVRRRVGALHPRRGLPYRRSATERIAAGTASGR